MCDSDKRWRRRSRKNRRRRRNIGAHSGNQRGNRSGNRRFVKYRCDAIELAGMKESVRVVGGRVEEDAIVVVIVIATVTAIVIVRQKASHHAVQWIVRSVRKARGVRSVRSVWSVTVQFDGGGLLVSRRCNRTRWKEKKKEHENKRISNVGFRFNSTQIEPTLEKSDKIPPEAAEATTRKAARV